MNKRYVFVGLTDDVHRMIGRSLGSGGDSDDSRLHEGLVDGLDAWDCDEVPFERVRGIYVSLKSAGAGFKLYERTETGFAEWEEDDETRKAFEKHFEYASPASQPVPVVRVTRRKLRSGVAKLKKRGKVFAGSRLPAPKRR